MHEMAIAEQLLATVLNTANANSARSVSTVELEIGEMRLIMPKALELAFEALSEGTIAEGAVLKISEKKVVMLCAHCDARYSAEIGNYICPSCGRAEGRIEEGNEITITAIECDIEELGEEQ